MTHDDPFPMLAGLHKRAQSGDVEAQYELGWRHALGLDAPLDDETAIEWIKRAADNGHMLAQNNLGARYFSGDGVEEDLQAAYRYFFLAAHQGDRKASKNLDALARRLPPDVLEACRKATAQS